MTRARWGFIGGAVVGAAAASLAMAGCGSGGGASESPSTNPSSSASANPAISASPAPTPSPAPSGFLPVDSLGASEIPWDEVGPGWFLVEWVAHPAVYGEGDLPTTPADFAVSLLAPDLTTYAGPSLVAAGADWTVFWRGDSVAVFDATSVSESTDYVGNTSLVSLRDGSTRQIIANSLSPGWFAIAADGNPIGAHWWEGGGGGVFYRYDTDFAATQVSPDVYVTDASLSPDGERLVYLGAGPLDMTHTTVWVSDLGDSTSTETAAIDTLREPPDSYSIVGWLDPDTLVLYRREGGPLVAEAYFSYNITTRTIADFALPFVAAGWVRFDWASQTYSDSVSTDNQTPMGAAHFYEVDGRPIASVPCEGSIHWRGPVMSARRSLVACTMYGGPRDGIAGTTLSVVDLDTRVVTEILRSSGDSFVGGIYPYRSAP